ncbi:MAG: LLM class F420-dependent oxidoreductase [Actinobacteria bacterium]|nr:LLM class F420-dependent oxidoreductase [Actinomycetota bacterium]NIW27618.1 TIGR03620 family F420-dependent LLM class oxidoreductase [Actinomycetota bacterium]
MSIELGRIGVWQRGRSLDADFAKEIERLGYGAVWVGGSPPADLRSVEELLDRTSSIAVATGIVNVWSADADAVAASYHRIAAKHGDRFLLGVGVGHPENTDRYARPYHALVSYLDRLDEGGVPADRRALAALGPAVLRLAAERSAGAHPYLTPPEHTRRAREVMGAGALLAPEHKAVLESDRERARKVARSSVAPYLRLRNYRNNLLRLGYSEDDLADSGSDRIVDDLVAHGDPPAVASAVAGHLDAGADHVCVQVLGDDPLAGYGRLAAELL